MDSLKKRIEKLEAFLREKIHDSQLEKQLQQAKTMEERLKVYDHWTREQMRLGKDLQIIYFGEYMIGF